MPRPSYLQPAPLPCYEDLPDGEPLRVGERLQHQALGVVEVTDGRCRGWEDCGMPVLRLADGRLWCEVHREQAPSGA